MNSYLDTKGSHLIAEFRSKSLTDWIVRAVIQVETCANSVFNQYAVFPCRPAALLQNRTSIISIGFHFHIVRHPRCSIWNTISSSSMTWKDVVDHGFSVNRIIHSASQREILCDIIAKRIVVYSIFFGASCWHTWKWNTTTINWLTTKQFILIGRWICHGSCGIGDIYLTWIRGSKRSILFHEHHNNPLHSGCFAIVIGIRR